MIRKEDLFLALENTDDRLLERSEKKSNIGWIVFIATISVVTIISGIIYASSKLKIHDSATTVSGVSGAIVNDICYYKSGWDTAIDTCPNGFTLSGAIETTNDEGIYLLNCAYYTNDSIPEWIYILCPVWDSSNNSSMRYVRFVVEESRFHYYLSYEGNL